MVVRASWVRKSEILSAVDFWCKIRKCAPTEGGAPSRAKFSHGILHVISHRSCTEGKYLPNLWHFRLSKRSSFDDGFEAW